MIQKKERLREKARPEVLCLPFCVGMKEGYCLEGHLARHPRTKQILDLQERLLFLVLGGSCPAEQLDVPSVFLLYMLTLCSGEGLLVTNDQEMTGCHQDDKWI
jgi:hypothetical protein